MRDILLLVLPDGEKGYNSLSVVKELKGCSAIVIEPTLSTSAWFAPFICIAQLGGAYIEVEIKGIPSHISTSWCAKNPIMSAIDVFSIIKEFWPSHPLYPTHTGVASDDLLSSFLLGLPTIVPIKVQTRGKAQSTPESIVVGIYSTLPPNYRANNIIKRLSARLKIENASIKVLREIPFFMENANADIVKSVYVAIREVYGVHPLYEWFPWPTAAHILKAYGIADEVVIIGPGSFKLAHSPNECVNVNDLISAMKIFMKVAGGEC
jgi:acetylornithine deacetylase/succinyl-diaminopimelate desuccinylase-like protein